MKWVLVQMSFLELRGVGYGLDYEVYCFDERFCVWEAVAGLTDQDYERNTYLNLCLEWRTGSRTGAF